MKHSFFYLFLLIFGCFGLFSCGDSDDNFVDEDDIDKTPYKVTFNIDGFSESRSNNTKNWLLPSGDPYTPYILQYVIYKEDGDTLMAHVSGVREKLQDLKIEKKLVPGKYSFAIGFCFRTLTARFIWRSSNFNTDYCSSKPLIMGGGTIDGIYFESVSFEVNKDSNKSFDLKLQDMGKLLSGIKVNITNYDSYTYPIPTSRNNWVQIGYRISASHRYFGVKTKEPLNEPYETTSTTTDLSTLTSIDRLKENRGLWNLPLLCGSDNVKIELLFIEHGPSIANDIVGSELIYEGKLESGKNITFTGELGKPSSFVKSVQ